MGIGDAAAWAERFGELDVLAGEKILIAGLPFIPAPDKQAAAVVIAKKAIDQGVGAPARRAADSALLPLSLNSVDVRVMVSCDHPLRTAEEA